MNRRSFLSGMVAGAAGAAGIVSTVEAAVPCDAQAGKMLEQTMNGVQLPEWASLVSPENRISFRKFDYRGVGIEELVMKRDGQVTVIWLPNKPHKNANYWEDEKTKIKTYDIHMVHCDVPTDSEDDLYKARKIVRDKFVQEWF